MSGPIETPKEAARRLAAPAIRDGYKPEALLTYTYPDGGVWYWRIRLKNPHTGKKWIRPMRLDGAGFELCEPDFPDGKPLYRLHDLTGRPDDGVIVVEGEWKADALAKAGVLATTSGAADSAAKADWRPLAGRDVIIWPDNDEAGQRYATEAAERLLALGCTVRVIDVDKLGLPEKGDALDWLKANPAATAVEMAALPCGEARQPARPGNGASPGGFCGGEERQEPNPIQAPLHPVPSFDPETLLPKALRGWVKDEADRMPCPPDFIAAAALVGLGAIIGARCAIKPKAKDDWLIVPNLWGGIVGLPSAKKSPTIGVALKPLERLIALAMEAHRADMEAFEADKVVFEAKEEAIKVRIKAVAKDAKKGIWAASPRNCNTFGNRHRKRRSCGAIRRTIRPSKSWASCCGRILTGYWWYAMSLSVWWHPGKRRGTRATARSSLRGGTVTPVLTRTASSAVPSSSRICVFPSLAVSSPIS
jgi:5S rRNA maturation endonuclease (ribonuclease M5)